LKKTSEKNARFITGGVMKMRKIEGSLDVPAGGQVELKMAVTTLC
jgi:copper(I)-binding protein